MIGVERSGVEWSGVEWVGQVDRRSRERVEWCVCSKLGWCLRLVLGVVMHSAIPITHACQSQFTLTQHRGPCVQERQLPAQLQPDRPCRPHGQQCPPAHRTCAGHCLLQKQDTAQPPSATGQSLWQWQVGRRVGGGERGQDEAEIHHPHELHRGTLIITHTHTHTHTHLWQWLGATR